MLTIAGNGPSATEYGQRVDIATKKRPLPSDYVVVHYAWQFSKWGKGGIPIAYIRRCNCGKKCCEECGYSPVYLKDDWYSVWKPFIREKRPPQRVKPSLGLKAVFAAIELFNPKEIGLIGFDNILDGNTKWEHDAIAEKACIESLVTIIDLRHRS